MTNYIKSNQKNEEFLENNEEKLLKYIDKKGEYYLNIFKGSKNKINYCALFLGPLWMGYRQMYFEVFILGCLIALLGNLLMLFELFISGTFIPEAIIKGFNYGLTGLIGIFGNYFYFLSLKKRIINENGKIGISKIGILYGFILGVLMPMAIAGITGFILMLLLKD
ncbi:DUF2628 domain-containing protein [Cetobacterium sp. 2A]|uniref:DUF2628 domain-containing protein n=1 Tax=Cetobacterium sp. 2A TaxID=2754723 RepID=UPI00163BB68C|nr:DUF2628 domain-containing protein [Cetobacterium sp. 2A]MBC2857079.1 DUF2628 domain-containing protein [Cetobacterium sp. 2A]